MIDPHNILYYKETWQRGLNREEKNVDHAKYLVLFALLLILVTIRLARRKSRCQKPQLPALLRSRLLKTKIATR